MFHNIFGSISLGAALHCKEIDHVIVLDVTGTAAVVWLPDLGRKALPKGQAATQVHRCGQIQGALESLSGLSLYLAGKEQGKRQRRKNKEREQKGHEEIGRKVYNETRKGTLSLTKQSRIWPFCLEATTSLGMLSWTSLLFFVAIPCY